MNDKIDLLKPKEKLINPLPLCTKAPHPEMVRNADEDDPCNDGTGL